MKFYAVNTPREVSRGQLTEDQIVLLDEALAHHGLEATSPHSTPETVAAVCLKCGTVSVAHTRENRDVIVENYDLTCCGLTVTFHSDNKVLVNPDLLVVIVDASPISLN